MFSTGYLVSDVVKFHTHLRLRKGAFRVELGFTDYHRIAFGTNYMQEEINSKIGEYDRLSKCSIVQLVTLIPTCRVSSPLIPRSKTCY